MNVNDRFCQRTCANINCSTIYSMFVFSYSLAVEAFAKEDSRYRLQLPISMYSFGISKEFGHFQILLNLIVDFRSRIRPIFS